MTPTNLFGFIFFCAFIAPGLFYNFLRSRRTHEKNETQFEELGRILVTSTVITMSASILVFLLLKIPYLFDIDFKELISKPGNYIGDNLGVVFAYIVLLLTVGSLISFLVDYSIVTLARMKRTSVHQWQILFNNVRGYEQVNLDAKLRRLWRAILIKCLPKFLVGNYEIADESVVIPVVRITTGDHRNYIAMVDLFSEHSNVSEREIIVSPIRREYIQFLPTEWRELALVPPAWKRMHLAGAALSTIEVLHWEFPKQALQ